MRFLLKEQPYEQPLAAGTLRYGYESGSNGVLEDWRLTDALDGYRFLRFDLDERAISGRSLLFHLMLNGQNRVENLRFRMFAPRLRVEGQVIIEDEMVTVVRTVNEAHFEDELPGSSADLAIFVPTAAGFGLLRPWAGRGPVAGLMLNSQPLYKDVTVETWFAPQPVMVTCDLRPQQDEGAPENQMDISWWAVGDESAVERVTLTVRDPHTAVIGAMWPSGLRAEAVKTIHFRRSGR